MTDPSYKLRAGTSGPVVQGAAGDVLTANADGSVSFKPLAGGALNPQHVTATTANTVLDFTDPPTRKFIVLLEASTLFEIVWPTTPQVVIIQLVQGAGAPWTPAFPAEVRFSNNQLLPTWATTLAHWDELAIDWDGTFGTVSYGNNYSP